MAFKYGIILSTVSILQCGLTACYTPDAGKNLPSDALNSGDALERPTPTSFTLKAQFMLGYDQLQAGNLEGTWNDGKGKWNPSNGNSAPSLTRTLDQSSLNSENPFDLKVQDIVYKGESLSFAECAFVKELGYKLEDFKTMTATYNLESAGVDSAPAPEVTPTPVLTLDAKLKLMRAVLGSSGSDPKAVRCDRFSEAPLQAHEINVVVVNDAKSPFTVYRGNTLITPKTATLSSVPALKVEQKFSFTYDLSTDPTKLNDEYTIKTNQGDRSFTPSYKACIRQLQGPYSNPSRIKKLISETITVYLDDKNELQEGKNPECCFTDGTCSAASD